MKWRIGKRGLRQCALVAVNAFNDCIVLIVKNEGDEVVVGDASEVARFFNKDGEFAHGGPPFLQKMPGVRPRLLEAPLFGGNRFLYSMRSDGFQFAPCGWDGVPDKALNEWHLTSVRDIKMSVISKERASKCRGRFPRLFSFRCQSKCFSTHPLNNLR